MCYAFLCTIAFAAISGVLSSCAKEELDYGKLDLVGEPKPVTVKAQLPQPENTDKTTIDGSGYVHWELSDQIVVNGTALQCNSIDPDPSLHETKADFSGSVGAVSNTHYWAIYPTTLNATGYNTSNVTVTLPATQTHNGDHIPSYMVSYANTAGNEIEFGFRNLCSIIKIPVRAERGGAKGTLSRIEITSNQNLVGTATVNWNGGNPTLTGWSSAGTSVTLDCGNADLNHKTVTFSIMVPAQTHNLSVKFSAADDYTMTKTLTGKTLARNTIYTTGEVNFNPETPPPGALSYAFSVSPTKKVLFANGNLQWTSKGTHKVAGGGTAAGTWRFATEQYHITGNETYGNADNRCSSRNISSSCTGWFDYFNWGASGCFAGYEPYNVKAVLPVSSIAGTNFDWGVYNAISNAGNEPGLWRILTEDEWHYLIGMAGLNMSPVEITPHRANATRLWCFGYLPYSVGGDFNKVYGMFIFPDNWSWSDVGLTFKSQWQTDYEAFHPSAEQWETFEAKGAAFLPAAGYRWEDGYGVDNLNPTVITYHCAHYWSTTQTESAKANAFSFRVSVLDPYGNSKNRGMNVRLVRDVKE